MNHRLRSVEVSGFTSIGHAALELRNVNILIGANGAGKSNFIRALEMLSRIVAKRLSLYVGEAGGASALLNQGANRPNEMQLVLTGNSERYLARLALAADDSLIFADEEIGFYFRSDGWHHVSLGRGHRESKLGDASVFGDSSGIAELFLDLLSGCRVYHFHDTSRSAPVKRSGPTADNLMLRSDAANLAAILMKLRTSTMTEDAAAYRRIVGVIRQVAPFFDDFVLQPHGADNIRLRWQEKRSEVIFSADQMSDGTLRFVCLATLLLSPGLPRLVVLDEPELGLHPSAIVQLADLLRSAATHSQVLVATQSVTLLNQFDPEDLVIVERSDDGTTLHRPDTAVLATWLEDYTIGDLWEKNIIGGRPGRAGRSLT